MSEIKDLRQENCKLEEKLSKLDDEIKKVAVNREMDDLEKSEAKDLANQKEFWKIRDKKTAKELRKLKSKFVNGTPKNPNQTIPAELWGYRTSLDKAWLQETTNCSVELHIFLQVQKVQVLQTYPNHRTYRSAARIASGGCEDQNIYVREMFADALERAINATEQHTVDVEVSWAIHPYFEDFGKYETSQDEELDQDDDCAGYEDEQHADPQVFDDDEPWEGHAFDNYAEEEEAIDDHVPREDHAHYDTPEVETVGFAESDVPVEDDA